MIKSLFTCCLLLYLITMPDIINADCALTDSLSSDSIFTTDLEGITVTAARRPSIIRADRITYIPSVSLSDDSNIHDALEMIPGITVGTDGKITVNGQQGVTIYIDGRKSVLSGDALISYLKSIPSSGIAKIDILTAPSAKREASGPVTIINLQRKKSFDDSYSISLNTNGHLYKSKRIYNALHGEYSRHGHSLSIIYSGQIARNPSNLQTERPFTDYSEPLRQSYRRSRTDLMNNVSLSYDYQSSFPISAGISLNFNHFKRKEPATMLTATPLDKIPSITANTVRFITRNLYGGMYLKHRSSDPENSWNMSVDFFNHNNTERQLMENASAPSIKGDMSGHTFGMAATFDWQKSLSENWLISAGGRASYVKMDNLGTYDGPQNQQKQTPDTDKTQSLGSSFGYNENVNALYTEVKTRYGVLTATGGLRAEQSNLNSDFSGNESAGARNVSRHGLKVYPSLTLTVTTPDAGSWLISYSDRTRRPRFADLDPFIHLFDDITHVGGNIRLKESITRCARAVWTNNSSLRISVTGTCTTNEIVKCYRELTDRIVYVSPENLPRHLHFNLTLSANSLRLTGWWNLSANATLLYSNYHFPSTTGIRPNVLFTPMADMKSRISLPGGITAEISAGYKGRLAYGQATVSSSWTSNIVFKKTFLDNMIGLTAYVRDIFNSNHSKSAITLSGKKATLAEREFENMRRIGISLSVRFKRNQSRFKKENRNTCIDEMNRVNL